MAPDYWDGWLNQPRTRDEMLRRLSALFVRLNNLRRGDPESETIMKRIRELSDKLKEGQ